MVNLGMAYKTKYGTLWTRSRGVMETKKYDTSVCLCRSALFCPPSLKADRMTPSKGSPRLSLPIGFGKLEAQQEVEERKDSEVKGIVARLPPCWGLLPDWSIWEVSLALVGPLVSHFPCCILWLTAVPRLFHRGSWWIQSCLPQSLQSTAVIWTESSNAQWPV